MKFHCMLAFLLGLQCAAAQAGSPTTRPSDPFAFVFIDDASEKTLGAFPLHRSIYAKAIEKAAASGAKAVVLKFFFDKPGDPSDDAALEAAMQRTKVILQARLDEGEAHPNNLPARFQHAFGDRVDAVSGAGESGWIPLERFSAQAFDVGFIDHVAVDRVPLFERYRQRRVKSLYTCCVELALDDVVRTDPDKGVYIGGKVLNTDAKNQVAVRFSAKDTIKSMSLADLLSRPTLPELRERVVVIAWDGSRFEPVQTPAGKMRPHRAFCQALLSLYEQLR